MDLGKRRIGLAISDELGITAQGLPTLERTRIRDDLERLANLISEKNVGYPLATSARTPKAVTVCNPRPGFAG